MRLNLLLPVVRPMTAQSKRQRQSPIAPATTRHCSEHVQPYAPEHISVYAESREFAVAEHLIVTV